MLLQMPVFLALYWVLLESVEIRHSPWIFWIDDLSAKDPFFILPLIMGASMLLMQKLQPMPTDPTQAMVMKIMPIAFTFFFMIFPLGIGALLDGEQPAIDVPAMVCESPVGQRSSAAAKK